MLKSCAIKLLRKIRVTQLQCYFSSQSFEELDSQFSDQILQDFLHADNTEHVKKVDPQQTYALLFPGQGSQYVGMPKNFLDYPNVKEMFNVASDILEYNLLELCLKGPKSELDKTKYCQPAVMLTSLAAVEKIQETRPEILENCFAAAGYSVGEFAAMVFTGVLSFEDAVEIVKVRAEEMQRASDITGGGMLTVLGSAKTRHKSMCADAREYCESKLLMQDAVCFVAGYLSPNLRTIGGHKAALEFIVANKSSYHIKKCSLLPVSGAFHTELMYSAQKALKPIIKKKTFNKPLVKLYSNIDGRPYRGMQDIINKILDQIIKPVCWEQTMHHITSRPDHCNMINIIDVGPGEQLGTILKQCNGKAFKYYTPVNKLQ